MSIQGYNRLKEVTEEWWVKELPLFVTRVDCDTATRYVCLYSELRSFHPLIGHCQFYYHISDFARCAASPLGPEVFMKPMFEHLRKHMDFMEAPGL
jgi:hypothetical protein